MSKQEALKTILVMRGQKVQKVTTLVQFNFHDCMSANFLKCSSEMDGEIYALKKVLIATS